MMEAQSVQYAHTQRPSLTDDEKASALEGIYAVGYDLIEQESWSVASDVFRAMVLLAPSDERGWLALGTCHENLSQRDTAIELYSLGMLATPKGVRCRLALSRALTERGDHLHAESVLDAAEAVAEASDDETLIRLVKKERGGRS